MTTTRDELDTASAVLSFARDRRVAADRAEADLLVAAVTWAEQHPPESIHEAATWATRGGDCPLPLAGEGAPLVAEFCVAEFAAAIGRSTDGGRAKIAHGLELKHRLPRHWQRTQTGTLEPWRACRIAAATIGLSREAAAFVDSQLVAFAHRVGPVVLDRLVEQAIARFMPETAEANAEKAAEDRHVTFHHHQLSLNGTTFVQAELDLADALDLDAAITAEAEALRLAGSADSLDVRRAIAAGRLARRQLGLPLETTEPEGGKRRCKRRATGGALRAPLRGSHHRQHAAVSSSRRSTTTTAPSSPTRSAPGARLPRPPSSSSRSSTSTSTSAWPATRYPPGSPSRPRSATAPAPSPGAPTRPSTATPTTSSPTPAAAATCSCNTAPVCRRHHRLKTHTPWTYTVIDPGTYLWTSPHGYQFLRDRHGTTRRLA